MGKYRTTKKSIKEDYTHILGTGYCNLQNLLRTQEPFAYSTRAEGWACDYYEIDGVCISTGYSPLDSKRMKHDYNLEHEFDEKAREIWNNSTLDYETAREEVKKLLHEFIKEIKKQ